MKILIIRPEPGASASAARAKTAGFDPVVLPFFEVRPRPWSAPDPSGYDALLISSANAVRHAGPGLATLRLLPVHAVGERTAETAKSAGLRLASTGSVGIAAAIALAQAAGHRRLLWLAGDDRSEIRPPEGCLVQPLSVYASEKCVLPESATKTIAACELVALHSARAAKAFGDFVDAASLLRDQFILAAFAPAIAKAAGDGWKGVAIAEMPTDQALLSAARALVTHPPVAHPLVTLGNARASEGNCG